MPQIQRWLRQPSFVGRVLLCSTLTVLLVTPMAVFGQGRGGGPGQPGAAFTLRDGVVVDTAGGVAYVMAPEGGVDAVDLSRGRVLWSSTEAARPLTVAGNRLLAQVQSRESGVLEIVSLDTRRGDRMGPTASIALPAGVSSNIDNSLGRAFEVSARIDGRDATVAWRETRNERAHQGFVTAEEAEGSGASRQSSWVQQEGAARVDLSTGRVTRLAAGQPGAKFVAGASRLSTTRELQGVAGRQYVSGDGRHVLASERLESSGVPPKFRWTLHARDTGESRGFVDSRTAAAPFVVLGDRIVFETRPFVELRGGELAGEPLSIRVADLRSGAELWSKEIRDIEFRGPFPQ